MASTYSLGQKSSSQIWGNSSITQAKFFGTKSTLFEAFTYASIMVFVLVMFLFTSNSQEVYLSGLAEVPTEEIILADVSNDHYYMFTHGIKIQNYYLGAIEREPTGIYSQATYHWTKENEQYQKVFSNTKLSTKDDDSTTPQSLSVIYDKTQSSIPTELNPVAKLNTYTAPIKIEPDITEPKPKVYFTTTHKQDTISSINNFTLSEEYHQFLLEDE